MIARTSRLYLISTTVLLLLAGQLAAQVPPESFRVHVSDDESHSHGAQLFRMLVETRAGTEELLRRGVIEERASSSSVAATQLDVPVADTNKLLDSFFVSNFVDLDARRGNGDPFDRQTAPIQDFQCGVRSYDGHNGVDILAWPFFWSRVDEDSFVAVAAADGTIVARQDGNFDERCAVGGSTPPNFVSVRHADGTSALYTHLKKGSVTAKGVGAAVRRGEILGTVASSGNSTAPHLHFHVLDRSGKIMDPFRGPCSTENGPDLWRDRRLYPTPRITDLSVHTGFPEFGGCPARAQQNTKERFLPGERVFLAAHLADVPDKEKMTFRLYRPNGILHGRFEPESPNELTSASFFAAFDLPTGSANNGAWRYELDFGGTTRVTQFQVGSSGCRNGGTTICLNKSRFQLEVFWKDFQGNTGIGNVRRITNDTAYVWFFDQNNVEIAVKVLDARGVNGKFWVFFGALSDVRYVVKVTDTQTGEVKRYLNPQGVFASVGDTGAFAGAGSRVVETLETAGSELKAPLGTTAVGSVAADVEGAEDLHGVATAASAACTPTANSMCLNRGRFRVLVDWKDFQGNTGTGRPKTITSDTGYFWFFDQNNVEVVVKVLDARGVNGKYWVFFGALTNVEFTLTVEDTETGERRTYENSLGNFASAGDTAAFDG